MPLTGTFYCFACEREITDDDELIEHLASLQSGKASQKFLTKYAGLKKVLADVKQKTHQAREKIKLTTSQKVLEQVRPDLVSQNAAKIGKIAKNMQEAKELIPDEIFGIPNEGNSCFLAVILQVLNVDERFQSYLKMMAQNIAKLPPATSTF